MDYMLNVGLWESGSIYVVAYESVCVRLCVFCERERDSERERKRGGVAQYHSSSRLNYFLMCGHSSFQLKVYQIIMIHFLLYSKGWRVPSEKNTVPVINSTLIYSVQWSFFFFLQPKASHFKHVRHGWAQYWDDVVLWPSLVIFS